LYDIAEANSRPIGILIDGYGSRFILQPKALVGVVNVSDYAADCYLTKRQLSQRYDCTSTLPQVADVGVSTDVQRSERGKQAKQRDCYPQPASSERARKEPSP
jgi:hypothetical protein